MGGYTFSGFLFPVDHPPSVNSGQVGKTYPVKWSLINAAGANISALSSVSSVTYKSTTCTTFTCDPTDTLETTAAGGTGLRYGTKSNHYKYNLKTPAAGCITLYVIFDSNQVHYANFKLK